MKRGIRPWLNFDWIFTADVVLRHLMISQENVSTRNPAENPYCVSIDTTVEFNRNSIEYYSILYGVG